MLANFLFLLVVLASGPAQASGSGDDRSTAELALRVKSEEEKQEREEEISDAEKEEERKRKEKLARIIVLKWPEVDTNFMDETVRRNVRSRIARPDAMFFPEVDLYQNGRKLMDRTVTPVQQPAVVPDENIAPVLAAVSEIAGVPWNALQPAQWGLKAQELRRLAEKLWFVDRVELREPLFLLYAQIGKAADNSNNPAPPFFEQVGPFTVNYYFYLAATLAYQEPALMSKLTDQELHGTINYLLQQLQQGSYPSFKVDFEQENEFDEEWFNETYEILVNGLPIELDENAQMDVFLGRTDIYLKRLDTGHGLSERLEVSKLENKIYFVRDVARKKMGVDFIDQLFLHKNECTPEVDGDILTYLAIYAKLHSKAEVYIAVPENGNPNKVWIWRYDRRSGLLNLVGGGPDAFPVRFAVVFSAGLMYNDANVVVDDDFSDEDDIDEPSTGADFLESRVDEGLQSGHYPVNFEFRAHYNRLMVNLGAEFGVNGQDEDWIERYYTPTHLGDEDRVVVTDLECTEDEDGEITCSSGDEAYHMLHWNRYMYMGLGVVLGRDAGLGLGPRLAIRSGWTNLPHAWVTTGHFGWALQPSLLNKFTGRVRPFVDADFRAGMAMALANSLQVDLAKDDEDESYISPVFGATLGIGTTF
ncbi:MAG: hypothetical protein QGG40_11695 [Myxococcota bacterium]|jgi:hypothetical protein|nr:hypothetical protein [Myxococcota bacterium]